MRRSLPLIVCAAALGCFEDPPIVPPDSEAPGSTGGDATAAETSNASTTAVDPTTDEPKTGSTTVGPPGTTTPNPTSSASEGTGAPCRGPRQPLGEAWCNMGQWALAGGADDVPCIEAPGPAPNVLLDHDPMGVPVLHLNPAADSPPFVGTLSLDADLNLYCVPVVRMRIGCEVGYPDCGAAWSIHMLGDDEPSLLDSGSVPDMPAEVTVELSTIGALQLTIAWRGPPSPVVIIDPAIVEGGP